MLWRMGLHTNLQLGLLILRSVGSVGKTREKLLEEVDSQDDSVLLIFFLTAFDNLETRG